MRASYAYRPYGAADPALTKGDADPNAVLNPYRFRGKRLDVISGTLDMGARRFGPRPRALHRADRYLGAADDLGLALDPLTRNRYAFAGGNAVSFVETDGLAVGQYEGRSIWAFTIGPSVGISASSFGLVPLLPFEFHGQVIKARRTLYNVNTWR